MTFPCLSMVFRKQTGTNIREHIIQIVLQSITMDKYLIIIKRLGKVLATMNIPRKCKTLAEKDT